MASTTRALLTGTAATLLGTAVSAVLSMGYISLGARWLGPEQYGRVAVAISAANLVAVLFNPVEVGLTLRAAGFVGRGELAGLRDFNRRSVFGLASAGALIWVLWSGGALIFSDAPRETALLASFACASLVAMGGRAGLRGREAFLALAGNWVLESAVRLAVGLGLVALAAHGSGMIAGYAAGSAAALVHALYFAQRGLPSADAALAAAPRSLLHPFSALSAPLLGLHLYQAAVINVDMLVVGRFLAADQAGLYGGAASIARIVLVAAHPLLLVIFSRLAALSAARSDTHSTMRLGVVVVLGGLGLSLVIPLLGGELLLTGFLGSAYAGASPILSWQWATACALVAQSFFAESMLATARMRGGALFALPGLALVAALGLWHGSAVEVARTAFLACAGAGTLTLLLLWRWREPLG